MTRVFISYARVDLYLVKQLVGILLAGGHEPWYDHQLLPGQDWKMQLINGMDQCAVFVYALTPESVASEWCCWEFARAIEMGKPILPVLFQANTTLPDILSRTQYVDFTQGPTPEATARLLCGLSHVAVTIPPEQAPDVPQQPQGFPSRLPEDVVAAYRSATRISKPANWAARCDSPHTRVTRPAVFRMPRRIPVPRRIRPRRPSFYRRAALGLAVVGVGAVLLAVLTGAFYGILGHSSLSVAADGEPSALSVARTELPPVTATGVLPTATGIPPPATGTPVPCEGGQPSRLAVGMTARIPPELGPGFGLRVRSAPGLENPPSARMVAGMEFRVVDGPECADDLIWWKVHLDTDREGWAAESDMRGYYMIPLRRP